MVSIFSTTELARLIQGYRLCAKTEGKSDKTIAIVANSVSYEVLHLYHTSVLSFRVIDNLTVVFLRFMMHITNEHIDLSQHAIWHQIANGRNLLGGWI